MLRSMLDRFKAKGISRELEELAQKDISQITGKDICALRGVYRRFRVLVLGPANAGKTTLLERLSDSPAGAAIVTRDGKPIQGAPKGYNQRGIHRITDEITYASNPGFVFHDSGGFEMGAEDEIKTVWNFIRKRSSASLSEQLHAIWLCIPTDSDRPFGFLNSGFFSKSTEPIPVIAIFTKLDGRETIELVNMLGADPSPFDIVQSQSQLEQRTMDFVHELETEFRKLPQPPASFTSVGSMHKITEQSIAFCNQLLQITMNALPPGILKLLLKVSIQNRNRRMITQDILQKVLEGQDQEGNIMERIPMPGGLEESELLGDQAFRTLWTLHYMMWEEEWEWWSSSWFLDCGSKACAPLLALLRQLPLPSRPQIQYLTFLCLVILCARHARATDSFDAGETGDKAGSIQAQIEHEFGDNRNRQMILNAGTMARRLGEIVDEYTPLDM